MKTRCNTTVELVFPVKKWEMVKQCLFGAALVNIRESLQISQYQLAKRTGIAEEYLNKLENSKREPKARMIIRLGRGLGISPGDLLNEMDRLMRLEEDE